MSEGLEQVVDAALDRLSGVNRLLVAYSGGRDSHVLLDLLARRRPGLPGVLEALHVDHGLHPASRDWARHCRRVADALGVTITVLEVDARPGRGEGPEAAARAARYRALAGCLEAGDCLMTAHHRDDQAETVLLQLLRGSGPAGLAAMPFSQRLGRGRLVRPLLDVPRATIERYARAEGLAWIDDPSNGEPALARNFLRHEILPRLESRWPAVSRTLSRSARHCADAVEIIESQAASDRDRVAVPHGGLRIDGLLALSPPRRRGLLRFWLLREGLAVPAERHIERIMGELLTARDDSQGRVDWPGGEVRVWRGRLYARRRTDSPETSTRETLLWLPAEVPDFVFPDGGRLRLRVAGPGQGLRRAIVETGEGLVIRFRRGGERCRIAGRPHHRRLKILFQEAGIPPWIRPGLPLIGSGDTLVAIPGVGICEGYAASPDETGYDVVFSREGRVFDLLPVIPRPSP